MTTKVLGKVLFVDDDPQILQGLRRQLHGHFDVVTAEGGERGLQAVAEQGPFAVIVADMRMPIMDGIQFLSRVKKIAPDSVRMMLTGNADLETAGQAVNEGSIFRFLTKPCSLEVVGSALLAGIEQNRLITAEKELLEKTLKGSMEVITGILSLIDPEAFGQVTKLKEYLQEVAAFCEIENVWELELAAMFARLGYVTVPSELRAKTKMGETLTLAEEEILSRVPEIGQKMMFHIPRLEAVAKIVLYQNKLFNGGGYPQDAVAGENIPWGSRLLKILSDLVQLEAAGIAKKNALEQLGSRKGWYDPDLLNTVCQFFLPLEGGSVEIIPTIEVTLMELRVNDLLISNVETQDKRLLIAKGNRITVPMLERLRNYSKLVSIKEPIWVERNQSQR